MNDFEIIKPLSFGAVGRVYLAKWTKYNKFLWALKIIDIRSLH